MEQVNDKVMYSVNVLANHKTLIKQRKKIYAMNFVLLMICTVIIGIIDFILLNSQNSSAYFGLIFVILSFLCAMYFLYMFFHPKNKVEDAIIEYKFYENHFSIKYLANIKKMQYREVDFMYFPVKNYQYLNYIKEDKENYYIKLFETRVFFVFLTGGTCIIPKDVFHNEDEMKSFSDFLENRLGRKYKNKE